MIYFGESGRLYKRRFEKEDLLEISEGWQERLRTSVTNLPSTWLDGFFAEIDGGEDAWPDALATFRTPG